jgi:hypothetical protein
MPDGRNRYTADKGALLIDNADGGQEESRIYCGLGVHGHILSRATDIYAAKMTRQEQNS